MQWYELEVQALERTLKGRSNGERPPVFYGSSSFRLWDSLPQDIDPRILNLAFGGSTLAACDYFFGRLVAPVHPRSLLLYAGDNDLGDGQSVDAVLGSYRALREKVRTALGAIPFGFVSVKPSPARQPILDRIRLLNNRVREEIAGDPASYYVDVFSSMLDPAGQPDARWYLDDGLHMNREGYLLWRRLLEPYRHQIFTE